jgi:hypothetical protein
MGKISHNLKLEIIRLQEQGLKTFSIVKHLNSQGHRICRQQVNYWCKQYISGYFVPGVINSKKVIFKKVCVRDAEIVEKTLRENPQQSATNVHKTLKSDGYELSLSTTKRIISAVGYTSASPRYGQLVRDTNKEKRIHFCQTLVNSNDTLCDIIFTDECSVQLHQNKQVMYRCKDTPRETIPKPKHPLKVHVWGGISRRGKSKLVIFEGIMEKTFFTEMILRDAALPFIGSVFPSGHRLQMDNDPKHKSKMARDFMRENGINHWDVWPSGNWGKLLYLFLSNVYQSTAFKISSIKYRS